MARREAVNDTEHLAVPTRPEPPMPAPDAPSDENGIDELLRPLDALLAKLRTGSTGDQLVAIQRVHEIVWRGAEQNRLHDELRTMGALELMVTLVQSPNLLVRRESLHILWSLSSSARNARALVDMPGALDAIVRLLPARRTASKAGLLARTQLDETGASEASRVEILAPAAVATLRNVALQRGAPAQLVRAGAVGGLLRLLLGVDLDDVELVDVLLVLWRLSASPDEGESIRTVGSGAPRNTRFVIGKDGSGGEDSGAVDAGAAAGAAPPIASASGCETVGAVASPETRARADGVDADVAADDCAAAVTAHALAEMRADSVLARLSGLAVGAPLPRGITMEQRLAFAVGLLALDLPDAPAAHRLQWLGLALADPQAWSDEAVWASPRWYVHWPSPGSLERSRGRLERGLEALVEAPLPAAQFLAARDALEDRLRAAAEGKAALPLAVTFSLAEVSNPLVWGPDVVAALRPEAVRAASEAVLAANTVYAVSGSGPNAPGVVKRSQEGLFR